MARCSGLLVTRAVPKVDGGIRVPTAMGMSLISRTFTWNHEDLAMEIGCGYEDDSPHRIIPFKTKFKKYFIIDVDSMAIHFTQNICNEPRVEYHVADIELRATLKEEWLGKMTKLISLNAFHCLKTSGTQRPAFENVFSLLAPGGEALLLFVTWHPFWEVDFQIMKTRKWEQHKDVLSEVKWNPSSDTDEYRKILTDMGFEVLGYEYNSVETVYKDFPHVRSNYIEYCTRYLPAMPNAIEAALINDRLLFLRPHVLTNQNGEIFLKTTILCLHLRKPSNSNMPLLNSSNFRQLQILTS